MCKWNNFTALTMTNNNNMWTLILEEEEYDMIFFIFATKRDQIFYKFSYIQYHMTLNFVSQLESTLYSLNDEKIHSNIVLPL